MARQSLAGNVLLAALVGVGLAGALEWGARAWERRHPPPPKAEYLWDWERMWEGDFYTVGSAAVGWPSWEEFNPDGLRDRAHAEEKPPRTARVVFLGDSVTLGDGLEPSQAYPQVLQADLDLEGRQVEVFNVALWGWSTRQERLAFDRIARRYRPDVVVLAVCLNDIPELQNNLTRPPAWLARLHERSALVRLIVNAPGREIRSVEELFESPRTPKLRAAFDRFFEEVLRLQADVRLDGARLALAVFPFRFQLEPGAPPPVVQVRFGAFCREQGLACEDLLPTLQALGPAAFRDYDHLSAAGARAAAAALRKAAWFPSAPAPQELLGERAKSSEALRAALGAGQAAEREAAALLLGRAGPDARASAALLERLRSDDDAGVRGAAARALGELAANEAAPALFDALGDRTQTVRWAAARALARLRLPLEAALPRLVERLRSPDLYVRGFAAWSLGEYGSGAAPAVGELAAALEREDREPGVAAQALAKIGPPAAAAVSALCRVLGADSARRRWNAAVALGRVGPAAREDAVEPLRRALVDEDPRVRAESARALGRVHAADAPSVMALRRALADESEHVRATAARALGWLGGAAEPAVPALNGALRDQDERVRREAGKALRRIQEGVAGQDDDPLEPSPAPAGR